jgi:hypothetical protein
MRIIQTFMVIMVCLAGQAVTIIFIIFIITQTVTT